MRKGRAPTPPAVTPHYYCSTNRVGAGILFWLPALGGGGAAVLGSGYAFLAYLCSTLEGPLWRILILPFIILPLFAVLLAVLAWCVCQLGKVRRRTLRLPIALCVGAMGLCSAWSVYLSFGTGRTISQVLLTWWMSPAQLWRGMRNLAAANGQASWVRWALEVAAIFGFIVYLMKSQDAEVPFCEKCGRWTDDVLTLELDAVPCDALAEQLAGGRVDGLRALGPRPPAQRRFTRARVLQCPCGASRFVTVERVSATPGKEGRLTFRANLPGRGSRLRYDVGSPSSEDVGPIVANLEIDFETQRKLEDLRSDLLKTD